MLYGWFTRIMNRPKKVNAVAVTAIPRYLKSPPVNATIEKSNNEDLFPTF